jgi:hypothetical protein
MTITFINNSGATTRLGFTQRIESTRSLMLVCSNVEAALENGFEVCGPAGPS